MIFTDTITGSLNATTPTKGRLPNNGVDKDAFLRLLTTQLRNQDPLNPMDQENFVQQMATFSNLEQTIEMNQNFSRLLEFQAVSQAASLIGQDVTALLDGDLVQGKVEQVIFVNGQPVLALDSGAEVPHTNLISVGKTPNTEPPAEPPTDEAPPAEEPPTEELPTDEPPAGDGG
ncbi:MAG TPA: flagellar hook capping FlgD N-terminal domain-containing protein [bacterium]|nr:flagellar hook capping FlgD N-terminal domain-containing protein [bacterium]